MIKGPPIHKGFRHFPYDHGGKFSLQESASTMERPRQGKVE